MKRTGELLAVCTVSAGLAVSAFGCAPSEPKPHGCKAEAGAVVGRTFADGGATVRALANVITTCYRHEPGWYSRTVSVDTQFGQVQETDLR